MKIISLNESQFGRLFEGITDGDFGDNPVPDRFGAEVTDQAKLNEPNASTDDTENSDPTRVPKTPEMRSIQDWGAATRSASSRN